MPHSGHRVFRKFRPKRLFPASDIDAQGTRPVVHPFSIANAVHAPFRGEGDKRTADGVAIRPRSV
jgi:hypothetical protein